MSEVFSLYVGESFDDRGGSIGLDVGRVDLIDESELSNWIKTTVVCMIKTALFFV